MSIFSISGSIASADITYFAVAQSATQASSTTAEAGSGTTVTLSAASTAYQGGVTGMSAAQQADAASEALAEQFGNNVLQNSQLILQTGQANMASAMQSFAKDWDAEKQTIAKLRPDLLNQRWDIVTDQGTIQVTSSTLSASDKAWLTGILNQNANLVADTQNINTVIVSTFGGTAAMAANDPMGMTLTNLNQSSVDGTMHFLSLLAEADTSSYYAAIDPLKAGEKFFKVIAPVGSVLNNPVAGSISAISDLDPVEAEDGSIAFPQYLQIASDKSDQSAMYADTLNVAFNQFLQPAFASSSTQDGIGLLASMNLSANVLAALSDTSPFNGEASLWWTRADGVGVGEIPVLSQAQLNASATSLSTALGANYRSYGEALTATASSDRTSSSATTSSTADPSQTAAAGAGASAFGTGSASTGGGMGAIQSVYEGSGQSLSPVQKAIEPAMQSLDNDWNVVKVTIAAKRPDLLDQKWDFVTGDGTVQVVSNTLTAEQESWLTGILNQNQNLVSDTQTVNSQLVLFYQKNPLGDRVGDDGQANVALPQLTMQDIDGIIPFLALMAGTDPASLIRQGLENEMEGMTQLTLGYS